MHIKMKPLTTIVMLLVTIIIVGCDDDSTTDTNGDSVDNTFDGGYYLVDTDQSLFYDNSDEITAPTVTEVFYGQDAHYERNPSNYIDNGNGTITDLVTGLMWSQTTDLDDDGDIDASDKMSYEEAVSSVDNFVLGGFDDWRLPTIKEMYSLILFSGIDVSGYDDTSTDGLTPFIDTNYFEYGYGDTDVNERIIDSQYASSTLYVSTTMNGAETMFGVNFADGRIKGYGLILFGKDKTFYVSFVRGNVDYGINDFTDANDSTIVDNATGLMWPKYDNGSGLDWEEALKYSENLNLAGYSDWRLPNAKELQSIVDYSRSPSTTNSAAIDPLFNCTQITNEAGELDYACYWTSTTHVNWSSMAGSAAAYVSFGRAMGYMNTWLDVHGAGAQRSDPKTGNPDDYPKGFGPQGDAIRINNYVRSVRTI